MPKTAVDLEELLYRALAGAAERAERDDPEFVDETDNEFRDARVLTFAAAGLLTDDAGLVLRFPGGEEFQIALRRSR
jgi:hypothetical protein